MIYCIDHNNILFQTSYKFNSGSILSGIPKECRQMSERPSFPPSWRKATWPQLMQKNSWSSLRLYIGFRVKHGLDEEQFDQTGKGHGYEKWDTCLNQGLWLLWWILKYCYCLKENIVHGTMNHIVYCLLSLYIVIQLAGAHQYNMPLGHKQCNTQYNAAGSMVSFIWLCQTSWYDWWTIILVLQ